MAVYAPQVRSKQLIKEKGKKKGTTKKKLFGGEIRTCISRTGKTMLLCTRLLAQSKVLKRGIYSLSLMIGSFVE